MKLLKNNVFLIILVLSIFLNLSLCFGYRSKNVYKVMKIGDPISASGGDLYFSMDFLNLGGPIPLSYSLNFRLNEKNCRENFYFLNNPRISRSQGVRLWVWNFGQDANELYFEKYQGNWVIQKSPIKYILKETGDNETVGYFYLMDPVNEIVYIFKKNSYGDGDLTHIIDRNGNTLTYTRDANRKVTRIYDGLGRYLDFTYDNSSGNLTEVTDMCGRTVIYNYDNSINYHCPASVTNPAGETTSFLWSTGSWDSKLTGIKKPKGNVPYTWEYGESITNDDRWVTAQKDAYDNKTTLSYSSCCPWDDCPPAIIETKPNNSTRTYEHYCGESGYGAPKSFTDENNNTISFSKDNDERINSLKDRLGDNTSFTYHQETGKLLTVTDAEGNTTTYTYQAQNQTFTNPDNASDSATFTFYNLIKITYPDGSTEQFTYDSKGNILTKTDTGGNQWTYTYNNRGQVLTETNPLGGQLIFTYNADGTLYSVRRSDINNATVYGYDTCKRVTSITNPDGSQTTFILDNMSRTTKITYPGSRTFTYQYDKNGNLIKYTDPLGDNVTYEYDKMDRLVKIIGKEEENDNTTFAYDFSGNIVKTTHPDGSSYAYTYNYMNDLTGITLGGKTWGTSYDKEGIPTSVSSPNGAKLDYQSNKLGLITSRTDALNHKVDYGFDSLYRMTSFKTPTGKTIQYSWNDTDFLSGITMPIIGSVSYERNALGLITKITDPKSNEWNFQYNTNGRIEKFTDPLNNSWTYTYNADTGILEKITFPDNNFVQFIYDNSGNIIRRNYSDGTVLKFTYDKLNRIISTDNMTFTYSKAGKVKNTNVSGISFGATYDNVSHLKTATYNNSNFEVTYSYDNITGLLTKVEDNLTNSWIAFSYDSAGNIKEITRSNGVNAIYTYDTAERLTKLQDGNFLDMQFTLNEDGKVTSVQITSPLSAENFLSEQTDNFSYDDANQINTTGYQYDSLGRLTKSDNSTTFQWDGAGRIKSININGRVYNFSYDSSGALLKIGNNSHSTEYFYNMAIDNQQIVAEKDNATGSFTKYYVWTPDGMLLYMIDLSDNNKVYFYHYDDAGNTIALTDSAGNLTDKYVYTPYGKLIKHEGNNKQPFTFLGKWGVMKHGESGELYQIKARYYSAKTGRFISRDPDWPEISSITNINPYQYANQNPVFYLDITGSKPESYRAGEDDPCQKKLKDKLAKLEQEIRYHRFLVETTKHDIEVDKKLLEKNIKLFDKSFWLRLQGELMQSAADLMLMSAGASAEAQKVSKIGKEAMQIGKNVATKLGSAAGEAAMTKHLAKELGKEVAKNEGKSMLSKALGILDYYRNLAKEAEKFAQEQANFGTKNLSKTLAWDLQQLAKYQAKLASLLAQKQALLSKKNRSRSPCQEKKRPRTKCRNAIRKKGEKFIPGFECSLRYECY